MPIEVEFACVGILIISTDTAHFGVKLVSCSVPGIGLIQFDDHFASCDTGTWTIVAQCGCVFELLSHNHLIILHQSLNVDPFCQTLP